MAEQEQKTKVKIKRKLLNADQENFCRLFVTSDTEFYGSGVQSYFGAYRNKKTRNGNVAPLVSYEAAKTNAHKLLSKPEIIKRINELLDAQGFNDQNVDKQHLFLLNQFVDYRSKLGAIKEYNELKQRVKVKPGGDTYQTVIFADGRALRIARRVLSSGESGAEESD